MNKVEHKFLLALYREQQRTGLPVTLRELAKAAGYSSPSTALQYVRRLEAKGACTFRASTARSVQITERGKRFLIDPPEPTLDGPDAA